MIYLDIETASVGWDDLDSETQDLWSKFAANKYPEDYADGRGGIYTWTQKAALHPEFGIIVCIAYAKDDKEIRSLTANSLDEEANMLLRFSTGLERNSSELLCAHNGKGFDFHYLTRRMVIRDIAVPPQLQVQGQKPWETSFVDTQELWGFGDMRRTVRLDVLCHALGIKSPKNEMSGDQVPQAWRDGKIEEIARYCEEDVRALREVHRRIDLNSR